MKETTEKLKLMQLVEDFTLYPRADVDSQHVQQLRWAIRAGSVLPPVIVDAKSKRIIDGFHRARAHKAEFGEDAEILVTAKWYATERDMFLDAMRYNASHGRAFSAYDRAKAALQAKAFKLSTQTIAEALNTTADAIEKICSIKSAMVRIAKVEDSKRATELVPIKRTIAHMAGKILTKEQVKVNERLSGAPAMLHVNELIALIENDMLDLTNERLIERLRHLASLVVEMPKMAATA